MNYTDKYCGACRNGRCDGVAVDQFSRGKQYGVTSDETLVLPATEMILNQLTMQTFKHLI